jgi:hypothetical protein
LSELSDVELDAVSGGADSRVYFRIRVAGMYVEGGTFAGLPYGLAEKDNGNGTVTRALAI